MNTYIKINIYKINHISKTKSRVKKLELKNPFQNIAHLSCKFGLFWMKYFFLVGDTRTWFLTTSRLGRFNSKGFWALGRSPQLGTWRADPPTKPGCLGGWSPLYLKKSEFQYIYDLISKTKNRRNQKIDSSFVKGASFLWIWLLLNNFWTHL